MTSSTEMRQPGFWYGVRSFWLPLTLFAAFSLALIGIAITASFVELNSTRRDAEENLRVIGKVKAEAIADWLDERRNDAEVLAVQLGLTRDIQQWLMDGAPQDSRAQRVLKRMEALNPSSSYRNIALADLQGKPLLSAIGPIPVFDRVLVDLIRESAQSRKLRISAVHAVSGTPAIAEIHICVPVISDDASGNQFIAVVVLTIDPALQLFPLISSWPGASPTAETFVVFRDGDSVVYVNSPRHRDILPLQLRLPLTESLPASSAALGVEGVMEGIDYRGVAVLAALVSIRGTPWHLVAKIDRGEAYAPVYKLAGVAIAAVGLLILVTGFFLLKAWRHQQSRLILGRYEAERGSAANAAILAAVHELSPDGILVVDLQGRWMSFNRRFIDMWEIPEKFVRSKRDAEAVQYVSAKLSQAEAFLDKVQYLGAHKEESSHEELALKDGRTFERHSVPLELANGEINGRVWFFRDVTERVEAAAGKARLASIVETSLDAIIGMNISGTITSWNHGAELLYGYSAVEMIGRHAVVLAHPECPDEIPKLMDKVLSGGTVSGYETVQIRKDGTRVDVSLVISPISDSAGNLVALSTVARDISERKKAEEVVGRTARALRTLSEANEALVRLASEEALYRKMCQVSVEAGGYRMAWIGLAEHGPDKLVRPIAHAGFEAGYLEIANISWGDTAIGKGPTGAAIREGVTQINNNTKAELRMMPWREEALKRGYASSIALPLMEGSRVFGALTIYASEPDAFAPEEAGLLEQLAADLSYGIVALRTRAGREAALQKLGRAIEGTVQAVAGMVEMRDPYTAGHEKRVARIATAVAAKMGLDANRIEGLRLAATIHDIGKIGIPSEILNKPTKLTRIEFELVKTHSLLGYDILKQVEFPWPVADMVLQHHERLDGSGYPNALKGDAILIEARILAVADVIESMMSHRPYRAALGLDAALAEIRQGRGRIYDPAVVDACLDVMTSAGENFFDEPR